MAGIIDGDVDRRQPLPPIKTVTTIPLKIILEFEFGSEHVLTECDVTVREYGRFFHKLETEMEAHPNATISIRPAPVDDEEQEPIGVPLERLLRIERGDGLVIYSRTDHPQAGHVE